MDESRPGGAGSFQRGQRQRVALLPLDDRPCNRTFPRRLAAIAGIVLDAPPAGLLGRFTTPGDCDALAGWLASAAERADGLIVSLDMLAFGGLVASRNPAASLSQARARLALLKKIRRRRPGLLVFAFSIIMRLGITVDSEDAAALHADLRRWAELVDAVRRLGMTRGREELLAIESRLPADLRSGYLRLRRRNHAVNMAALELAAEGAVDYLILAQEDAAPAGLHVTEQQELRQAADKSGAARRISIHPGADEAAMVLLSRHLCAALGKTPRILPLYGRPGAEDAVAGYEDRPISATVRAQIEAAGGELANDRREAGMFLLVHAPAGEPREASEAAEHPYPAPALRRFVRRVEASLDRGPVALADCAYSNGADPALIRALEAERILPRLHSYAGWNTAGNTIGTAVAHGISRLLAPRTRRGEMAHRRFLFERVLDDYAYQSGVRQEAVSRAVRAGLSPINLVGKRLELQRFVQGRLGTAARRIWRRSFPGPAPGIRARLPWPRLFEVEVTARLG